MRPAPTDNEAFALPIPFEMHADRAAAVFRFADAQVLLHEVGLPLPFKCARLCGSRAHDRLDSFRSRVLRGREGAGCVDGLPCQECFHAGSRKAVEERKEPAAGEKVRACSSRLPGGRKNHDVRAPAALENLKALDRRR